MHTFPLLIREFMQTVIIFDYSIILSLIFVFSLVKKASFNSLKYLYYGTITIVSFLLYLFGYSGSIAGFILAATVPYFMFNNFNSYKVLVSVVFPPVKIACILLLIFGAFLYFNVKDQTNNALLMGAYFITASINYVSLLFYGFTVLYLLLYEIKKAEDKTVSVLEVGIAILLVFSTGFYSAMYETRSTFVATVLFAIVLFKDNRKILVFAVFFGLLIFRQEIYEYFIGILGTDDIGKLAAQDIRLNSVNSLIVNSLDLNYDKFSETMSFSSLMNLFFCLFPFTFVFFADILAVIFSLFLYKDRMKGLYYIAFLGNAIFICAYQMDFLSIFVLFFVGQLALFEKKIDDQQHKANQPLSIGVYDMSLKG